MIHIRLVRFELTLFYTQSKCLTRLGYNLIFPYKRNNKRNLPARATHVTANRVRITILFPRGREARPKRPRGIFNNMYWSNLFMETAGLEPALLICKTSSLPIKKCPQIFILLQGGSYTYKISEPITSGVKPCWLT